MQQAVDGKTILHPESRIEEGSGALSGDGADDLFDA